MRLLIYCLRWLLERRWRYDDADEQLARIARRYALQQERQGR